MTDIETEARRRLNEAINFKCVGFDFTCTRDNTPVVEAMCRLLEEFEAYKREVSDAAEEIAKVWGTADPAWGYLRRFILPKPKPKLDPLVEALVETFPRANGAEMMAQDLREALAARGYEIREKTSE